MSNLSSRDIPSPKAIMWTLLKASVWALDTAIFFIFFNLTSGLMSDVSVYGACDE